MDIVRRRLQRATDEERDALKKILKAENSSNDAIAVALQKQSKSKFRHWFGEDLSYFDIVKAVAQSDVPADFAESLTALEDLVAEKAFNKFRESLSPAARADLDRKLTKFREGFLRDDSNGFGKLGGGLLAAQIAAQMSGFGVYMLASSLTAGLTHAIGLTLPFAAFTGLSSLISLAIGPIGIAVSLAAICRWLVRRDLSRSMWAIFYLAQIRHRTATLLAVSLGNNNPTSWVYPIELCTLTGWTTTTGASLGDAHLLHAELQESESFLSQLPGYWVVSGIIRFICDPTSSCSVLDKGLALVAAIGKAEQVCQLAECVLTHLQRLRPQRFPEVLEHVTKSIPAAVGVCYLRAPQDSEAHYLATMALAERILVVMEKH